MELCQGQQQEWFPLDCTLLRKTLDLPRMTLPEDGNWELTEGGALSFVPSLRNSKLSQLPLLSPPSPLLRLPPLLRLKPNWQQ